MTWIERIADASTSRRVGTATKRTAIGGDWEGIARPVDELVAAARESAPELFAGLTADRARDVYSLARMIRSEDSTRPIHALCVGEVARDEARARNRSITSLLTRATRSEFAATRGHYGIQRGRWASTVLDPRELEIVVARAVLEDGTQIARGARKFFSPRAQDGGRQAGRKLARDALDIVELWGAEGYQWIGPVDGVVPYVLMLFRRGGGNALTADARDVVLDGRRGGGGEPPDVGAAVLAALVARAVTR